MVTTGSIASGAATDAGLMAASIAVFGFLAHAWPALSRAPEDDIRWSTALGGGGDLIALALGLCAILNGMGLTMVIKHYTARDERREREARLLLR